jgi:hypothetical protein
VSFSPTAMWGSMNCSAGRTTIPLAKRPRPSSITSPSRNPRRRATIDELVLAPLALELGLDLCLGGLPNINHRLALQHYGGQELSARHRLLARRDADGVEQEAGRASAVLLSEGLVPWSPPESNDMLSWRVAANDIAGVGRPLILLLLNDDRIVRKVRLKPPSISS